MNQLDRQNQNSLAALSSEELNFKLWEREQEHTR